MPEDTTAPETAATEVLEPSEARPEDIFESQTGGGLPLEDCDSLNVRQVSEKLNESSVEEIERLRGRKQEPPNPLRRLDARLEAEASS